MQFDLTQLEELKAKLERFPEKREDFIKGIYRLYEQYRAQVITDSPVATGKLRRSWYAKLGEDRKYHLYNTAKSRKSAPYPYYVNYGHRIVARGGKLRGYYDGQKFMEKAIEKTNPVFQELFRRYVIRFMTTL